MRNGIALRGYLCLRPIISQYSTQTTDHHPLVHTLVSSLIAAPTIPNSC
jgi:hypothetical protein